MHETSNLHLKRKPSNKPWQDLNLFPSMFDWNSLKVLSSHWPEPHQHLIWCSHVDKKKTLQAFIMITHFAEKNILWISWCGHIISIKIKSREVSCWFTLFKGTLMQIWKSTNISIFIWKKYIEDFTLKHLLLFEICAREICENFVYKHSETIEYFKISLLFKKFANFTGK